MKWIDDLETERKGRKDALKGNDFQNDLLKKPEIFKVDNHSKERTQVRGTLRDRKLSLSFITGVKNMDKTFKEVSRRSQS